MDREIAFPFRLDGQGRVAVVTDPDRAARQHLTTYLLTRVGERRMRPDFGTTIRDEILFDNLDPLQLSLLTTRVQDKVGQDVRNVRLRAITVDNDYDQNLVTLTVEFARAVGTGVTESTTITLGVGQ